jgi:hypothetical protein
MAYIHTPVFYFQVCFVRDCVLFSGVLCVCVCYVCVRAQCVCLCSIFRCVLCMCVLCITAGALGPSLVSLNTNKSSSSSSFPPYLLCV